MLKRYVPAFLLAVLASFTFASFAHSQFVLYQLALLDIPISFATRLSATIDDWLGLLPGYGAVIGIALFLGFSIIGLLRRFIKALPAMSFVFGGFLAIATTLLAMHPLMEITLIAGARDWAGFVCQCLAGAVGGWLFVRLAKIH